jgi:hypothetical protein
LDTLNCTQSPNSTQFFDPNVHSYLPAETAQTNPNATNIIGQPGPINPNIPICNSSSPYWDGIACINCT